MIDTGPTAQEYLTEAEAWARTAAADVSSASVSAHAQLAHAYATMAVAAAILEGGDKLTAAGKQVERASRSRLRGGGEPE